LVICFNDLLILKIKKKVSLNKIQIESKKKLIAVKSAKFAIFMQKNKDIKENFENCQ
jgi:hypothetical protein